MLYKDLMAFGLTENEARGYLSLLELGSSSIIQIADKAGIKRPTMYLIIDALKEKGLVSAGKHKKKNVLIAEDPRKILDLLEERKAKMNRIMPELLSITNFIDKKPVVRFYEGINGIKDVYRDTLNYPEQEIQTFFSDSYATSFDEDFFTEFYIPKRVAKKIWAKAILPDQPIIRNLVKSDIAQLRQSKIVPKEGFAINVEINLYGKGKIGIISFEEQFALIIESRKIYESLKNIFYLIWNLLPDYKN